MREWFIGTRRFFLHVDSSQNSRVAIPSYYQLWNGIKFIEDLPEEVDQWRMVDSNFRVAIDWMPRKIKSGNCQVLFHGSPCEVMFLEFQFSAEIEFRADIAVIVGFSEEFKR